MVSKAVNMLTEVVQAQLERLLEVSDKCKALTKGTERQIAFFASAHAAHKRAIDLVIPDGVGGEDKDDGENGGAGGANAAYQQWRQGRIGRDKETEAGINGNNKKTVFK